MARILLVEDDPALSRGIIALLKAAGHAADSAKDGETALFLADAEPCSLVILDIGLPGISGFEVIKRLRTRGCKTPILVLTARDHVTDRVKGLDLGADDYLAKPFELSELEARARALIRRSHRHEQTKTACGPLEYDSVDHSFRLDGESLALTPRERAVLEVLILRNGRAINKETLSEKIFGIDESVNPDAIEIYVYRLRKKLERSGVAIVTLRGLGYLLEAKQEPAAAGA